MSASKRKALQGYGGQCLEPTLLIRSLIIKKRFAFVLMYMCLVCVLIRVYHVCLCVRLYGAHPVEAATRHRGRI